MKQLQTEVALGKNRGIYLWGHLIAVHDDMLILLGMGEKLFPQLHEPFIKQADKVKLHISLPPVSDLRTLWVKQNEVTAGKICNNDNRTMV